LNFASQKKLPYLTIMLLLYLHKKVGFTELQKLLQLTPGNLDHHLRKLTQAGYIKTTKTLSWRVDVRPPSARFLCQYVVHGPVEDERILAHELFQGRAKVAEKHSPI
jgi:DNA-binding transcriptional ArsR family regulator